MYKKLALCFLASISFSLSVLAQFNNHLILKKGYKNVHHYLVGDEIRVLHKNMDIAVIGPIQAIGEDYILLEGHKMILSDIVQVIHKRKRFNFVAAGNTLKIASPGLIGLAMINSLLQKERPLVPRQTWITAAAILGFGFLVPYFDQRNYTLGEKYFLRIVPADPALHQSRK